MVKKMLNEANKEEAGEGEKIIEAAERSTAVAAEESRNLVFMEDEPAFEIRDVLRAFAEGLGKGIFGNSYKAKVSGGPSVVVKRLRDLKPMTSEEFKKQLRMIGDMKHPNLLPLLAYYYSSEEKLLLYNYAVKGNLFDRIHGEFCLCLFLCFLLFFFFFLTLQETISNKKRKYICDFITVDIVCFD